MADGPAMIEIIAEPPWFMLFARWLRVSVAIDGRLARMPWGASTFEVEPGVHLVAVGAGSAFASKATLEITIAPGQLLRLRYTPRVLKNLSGTLVEERLPTARVVR